MIPTREAGCLGADETSSGGLFNEHEKSQGRASAWQLDGGGRLARRSFQRPCAIGARRRVLSAILLDSGDQHFAGDLWHGQTQRLEQLGQPARHRHQPLGHRRDSQGYAQALRDVDSWFARVQPAMRPEDAIFFTADHGVDPTYRGTDQTREHVPLLAYGDPIRAGVNLGTRSTYADLGQTLAEAFRAGPLAAGTSFAHSIGLA